MGDLLNLLLSHAFSASVRSVVYEYVDGPGAALFATAAVGLAWFVLRWFKGR